MCITGDHDTPSILSSTLFRNRKPDDLILLGTYARKTSFIPNSALSLNNCSSWHQIYISTRPPFVLFLLSILFSGVPVMKAGFVNSTLDYAVLNTRTNNHYLVSDMNQMPTIDIYSLKEESSSKRLMDVNKSIDQPNIISESRGNKNQYIKRPPPADVKLLDLEIIDFICHRLPNPCARAAYLRQNVRHLFCPYLPVLYLLPHIDSLNASVSGFTGLSKYQTDICEGGLRRLTYFPSDSMFVHYLTPSSICEHNLITIFELIKQKLAPQISNFNSLLAQSFCLKETNLDFTGEFHCDECQNAYQDWLCATEFPLYYPLKDDDSNVGDWVAQTSPNRSITTTRPNKQQLADHRSSSSDRSSSPYSFRLKLIGPCISWCTWVETVCPYFNPADKSSNGGEPAFLCDESHYHHSSRYQIWHRCMDYCDTTCCYSPRDLFVMSASSTASINSSQSDEYHCSVLQNSTIVDQKCPSLHTRCLDPKKFDKDSPTFLSFQEHYSEPSLNNSHFRLSGNRLIITILTVNSMTFTVSYVFPRLVLFILRKSPIFLF